MNNNHFSSILDGLTAAVFLIDQSRQVLFANRMARDLFGKDLVGYNFIRAVRHPDCVNCVDKVLAGEASSNAVVQLHNHPSAFYRVKAVRVESTDLSEVRAVVSFDDVSPIYNAEQMRSDFVANVSHELRSPLTAVSGFIETLKGPAGDDPSKKARFLRVMEQEAVRMDRLISDLLSLSKVESNARVRPTGTSDVRAIVQRVITILSHQSEEEQKTIELEWSASERMVPGDDDELMQVFRNLIENALKYSGPESKVLITAKIVARDPLLRGPAIAIAVSDQGPGIEQHHILRLTERFYRVDEGRSRDKGGTGLGLAIVKHIIGRHRGRLKITSELGVGSVFVVLLPVTMSHD